MGGKFWIFQNWMEDRTRDGRKGITKFQSNVKSPTWCGHSCVEMPSILGNWYNSRGLVGSLCKVWELGVIMGITTLRMLKFDPLQTPPASSKYVQCTLL
jgi:hypothetical protein